MYFDDLELVDGKTLDRYLRVGAVTSSMHSDMYNYFTLGRPITETLVMPGTLKFVDDVPKGQIGQVFTFSMERVLDTNFVTNLMSRSGLILIEPGVRFVSHVHLPLPISLPSRRFIKYCTTFFDNCFDDLSRPSKLETEKKDSAEPLLSIFDNLGSVKNIIGDGYE